MDRAGFDTSNDLFLALLPSSYSFFFISPCCCYRLQALSSSAVCRRADDVVVKIKYTLVREP